MIEARRNWYIPQKKQGTININQAAIFGSEGGTLFWLSGISKATRHFGVTMNGRDRIFSFVSTWNRERVAWSFSHIRMCQSMAVGSCASDELMDD
jgi:hypothetical protein